MSRRIVQTPPNSLKDENGAYQKAEVNYPTSAPPPFEPSRSIDGLLANGLDAIYKLMRVIHQDISTGSPDRATVQNLKDVMSMLHELKEKEDALLDEMDAETLKKIAEQDE